MSRRSPLPIATALLFFTTACMSSETNLTGPSASKCGVTITNSMASALPAGGSGTLAVATERDCTWAASSGAAWVVITSATSGQGEGSIAYRVAANRDPSPRQGVIEVNNAVATIAQSPAECSFTVSPRTLTADAAGGTIGIQVEPTANCAWAASTEAGWIRIVSGASGTGSGTVTLAVEPNSGADRAASVIVAGQVVTVTQSSSQPAAPAPPPPATPGCSYAIQPAGQTISAAGGNGTLSVTAGSACNWTAVSSAAWIVITSGATGAGAGTVSFTVSSNPGASRSGAIAVAGHTFTVTQGAVACSYSIAPGNEAMAPSGGTSTVTVTAGAACAWTSASNASWLTIASGGSGSGSGAVHVSVAANSGSARTGTVTIAGQTFTVTQSAAPCGFSLSPTLVDLPAGGGTGSTAVTTAAACAWTAVPAAPWIFITSAASGTGSGSVGFGAAANPGAARSGAVTVGGQTLTVTQGAAPCTFAINPSSQAVPPEGGTGSVGVTSAAGCGWTAAANDDWLVVTAGATGSGEGVVAFSVTANGTGAPRTGTIGIAGHTFTVTQDVPCAFSITPASQSLPAAGGSGSVTVTTGAACSWTASSNNGGWLTISAGASGTGSGTVSFSAAANSEAARTGTLTIAGQTFTVDQSAP